MPEHSITIQKDLGRLEKLKCHRIRRNRKFYTYKGIINCTSTYQDKKAVLQERNDGS